MIHSAYTETCIVVAVNARLPVFFFFGFFLKRKSFNPSQISQKTNKKKPLSPEGTLRSNRCALSSKRCTKRRRTWSFMVGPFQPTQRHQFKCLVRHFRRLATAAIATGSITATSAAGTVQPLANVSTHTHWTAFSLLGVYLRLDQTQSWPALIRHNSHSHPVSERTRAIVCQPALKWGGVIIKLAAWAFPFLFSLSLPVMPGASGSCSCTALYVFCPQVHGQGRCHPRSQRFS